MPLGADDPALFEFDGFDGAVGGAARDAETLTDTVDGLMVDRMPAHVDGTNGVRDQRICGEMHVVMHLAVRADRGVVG